MTGSVPGTRNISQNKREKLCVHYIYRIYILIEKEGIINKYN